jgi:hypothetical protein
MQGTPKMGIFKEFDISQNEIVVIMGNPELCYDFLTLHYTPHFSVLFYYTYLPQAGGGHPVTYIEIMRENKILSCVACQGVIKEYSRSFNNGTSVPYSYHVLHTLSVLAAVLLMVVRWQ